MTKEQKIDYMSIATRICGFNFKSEHLDLFVELYDCIITKKGRATILDIVKIEYEITKRYQKVEPVNPHQNDPSAEV